MRDFLDSLYSYSLAPIKEIATFEEGIKSVKKEVTYLYLKDQDKPVVVHGVVGNLYPLSELHSWPQGQKKSKLVFICRKSVLEQIRHMFNEVMSDPESASKAYYQSMIDNIERADDLDNPYGDSY